VANEHVVSYSKSGFDPRFVFERSSSIRSGEALVAPRFLGPTSGLRRAMTNSGIF
jgi:hypothetical protein